jgi:gliding motility-associated lipoprotein GldD|tara:strand:+ start:3207 stop:3767 length:561 start_codon:yes stop_codon:yes gene_type:complete
MKKLLISFTILLFISCDDTPIPKPHGYPRINLPERTYKIFDTNCAFTFKASSASKIEASKKSPCFFNISYPQFNAKLHLTYVTVNNNLKGLIDQEYKIREKHNQFATSVQERLYANPDKHINALIFNINGTKAATPLQFFMTDSTNHFFRGVLYFYNSPNNDSLEPVINYIKQDVDTLIESFEWKD